MHSLEREVFHAACRDSDALVMGKGARAVKLFEITQQELR